MVGIGPGSREDRTYRAVEAISSAHVIVGYRRYLDLITDLTCNKELLSSGMTKERERVQWAIDAACQGKTVALVSSGDPGVYGMAGLALELMQSLTERPEFQVIPGITAANSAGARLGAPLMLDYCCISLSDLMIPWEIIEKRLHAAGQGDFTVALYNPRSKKRRMQLEETVRILALYRPLSTPVGIVRNIGLQDESILCTTLGELLNCDVHMRSTVIIGNSTSRILDNWLITPRGYFEDDSE